MHSAVRTTSFGAPSTFHISISITEGRQKFSTHHVQQNIHLQTKEIVFLLQLLVAFAQALHFPAISREASYFWRK